MSKFDELRAAYTEWHKAAFEYFAKANIFAQNFTDGFEKYIGAPGAFKEFASEGRRPYIRAVSVVDENESTPKHEFELLYEEDGYLAFGIQIILDTAAEAFPKKGFSYHVRFRLRDDTCKMEILRERFEFKTAGDTGRVYNFMVAQLVERLSHRPWHMIEARKIGFLSEFQVSD